MNLNLDDVALFVRIVETGSLSAAARERNVPVSQVTRSLARLEAGCRARLLHRTTHSLSLTDEGDGFLQHARRLLDTAAELQGVLSARKAGPSGWVRVSVSAVLAQAIVAPSLPSLYDKHPGLHLDIATDDRLVDMAREGIDFAVRTGAPSSEQLVARPLGSLTRSLYAAPSYAARFGLPKVVAELDQHRLLANTTSAALNQWQWHHEGTRRPREHRTEASSPQADEPRNVHRVQGHTRTDNTAVIVALALNGVGIARIVDLVARPLVHTGALLPVLPGAFTTDPVPMLAVMLQERHRLPKVRACIDHLAEWMARA